jgi:glycosyltransferase involved in cell wall biosynthesis
MHQVAGLSRIRGRATVTSLTLHDLRVLHVFKYFRPDFTGEGIYVEKLASPLAALGIRSRVFVTDTAAPAVAPVLPALGQPHFCNEPNRPLIARLRAFLAEARGAEVVHFHSATDRMFLFHLLARLGGRRVVQSCTLNDGLGAVVDSYRPAYRGLVRRLCRLIDAVVAISPKLHDDSLRVFPPARVHLIPQGVAVPDLAGLQPRHGFRARLGFAEDDVVLLYVGGITPRKDVRFLVRHHPELPDPALPEPVPTNRRLRLLLIGPDLDAAYAASLEADMAARRPGEVVRLPFTDDPGPAYGAADLFVFASREEGFGNVLLEAMAAGLPVVARRLPGVTDSFIEDGRTGFLFDDAAQYDAIVRALAADAGRRRTVGAAARAEVTKRFSLDRIAERYARLYRSLLRRKHS